MTSWYSNVNIRHLRLVFLMISILIIFSSYSNTFESPPVLDDFHSFVDEPILRIDNWSIDSIVSIAKTKFSFQRWIPMITFAFDIWIKHESIAQFHITNIFIHLLNFLLVYIYVNQLLLTRRQSIHIGEETLEPFDIAVWVALLWALHPVQTNAVTYLVQRMTSLCTLFFLLSMSCYLAGRLRIQQGRSGYQAYLYYALSFVSMLMAFFSKENSAMIPVAIVLTECWFFQPELPGLIFRYCRRHWAVSSLSFLVAAWIAFKVVSGLIAGFDGRHFTALERLMSESRVVVWYLSVFFWPDPRRLSLEHDIELSTSLIHPVTTLLSIVFLLSLCWWTITRRKTYPLLTYGLMWLILNLLIESTIVPLELVFEHRMYLPSIGLCLALICGALQLVSRFRSLDSIRDLRLITWCTVSILAAVLGLTTFERNEVWRDAVTQSYDDATKNPNSPRARANFAVSLSRVGRCEEAIAEARAALSLGRRHYEEYGVAANTILTCYQTSGQFDKIVLEGKQFIEEWPKDADVYTLPSVWLYIARAQQELGKSEEAYTSLRTALALNHRTTMPIMDFEKLSIPLFDGIFRNAQKEDLDLPGMQIVKERELGSKFWVALQLHQEGYINFAERLYRDAMVTDANHAEICNEILTVMKDERLKNSRQQNKWSFEKKYVHHPFNRFDASMAISYLVREHSLPSFFRTIGEVCLDYALELDPNSSDAHLLKGWYYFERNQVPEALAAAHRAIDLEPDYAKAWMGLGFFLTKGPRPVEAVPAFSKALDLYPGYPQRASIIGIIHSLQDDA